MIKQAYWADCTIDRSESGDYAIYCTFQSNGKIIDADYKGKNFVKGINHILDSVEKQLTAEAEKDELTKLKEENAKLKSQLSAFTSIGNNFEKKLNKKPQDQLANNSKPKPKYDNAVKHTEKKIPVWEKENDVKVEDITQKMQKQYNDYLKTLDGLYKAFDEKTKNMTDEEYIDYIYKLFGIKK